MASVHDVAAHILQRQGRTTAPILHCYFYYAQGWHLAWDQQLLFPEP